MGDRSNISLALLLGIGAVAFYLMYRYKLSSDVTLPGSTSVDAPTTAAPQTITVPAQTQVSAPFSPNAPSTGLAAIIENAYNQVFPMQCSANGIALIQGQETCSLVSYWDVNGYSIGWGHKITAEDFTNYGLRNEAGVMITQELADQLFADDLLKVENTINQNVSVPLSQNQFDALCDFVFNVGSGSAATGKGFLGSTLLKDLNMGDYASAANEFAKWNKSGGSVNPVLVARRTADANLFQTA